MGSGCVVGCLLPSSCPMTLYKGSSEATGGRGSGAVGEVEEGGGEDGGEEDGGEKNGGRSTGVDIGVESPLPLSGSSRRMEGGSILGASSHLGRGSGVGAGGEAEGHHVKVSPRA